MNKLELNHDTIDQLLKSREVMEACKEVADAVAGRAGSGFTVVTGVGRSRAHATVKASSKEAIRRVLKENALLKAVK